MSEEQIQQLLDDLKTLAAPNCQFCAHNTPKGVDLCEDNDYECDICPESCPCRNCGGANNHAGWEWRGLRGGCADA